MGRSRGSTQSSSSNRSEKTENPYSILGSQIDIPPAMSELDDTEVLPIEQSTPLRVPAKPPKISMREVIFLLSKNRNCAKF